MKKQTLAILAAIAFASPLAAAAQEAAPVIQPAKQVDQQARAERIAAMRHSIVERLEAAVKPTQAQLPAFQKFAGLLEAPMELPHQPMAKDQPVSAAIAAHAASDEARIAKEKALAASAADLEAVLTPEQNAAFKQTFEDIRRHQPRRGPADHKPGDKPGFQGQRSGEPPAPQPQGAPLVAPQGGQPQD